MSAEHLRCMPEGHAALVYGVTVDCAGRTVTQPRTALPKTVAQSRRDNLCSITGTIQHIPVKKSDCSSWLLPSQQQLCSAVLQPLPQRERQLPANWLSQGLRRRIARHSNSDFRPASGKIEGAGVGTPQPAVQPVEHSYAMPESNPLGPYAQSYGVLPYRNIRHKKQVSTNTPWDLQEAWKAAQNHSFNETDNIVEHIHDESTQQTGLHCSARPMVGQLAANQSIDLLYSQEDLTGPIHHSSNSSHELVMFRGIPKAYNCHSSLRRIAWERTLRLSDNPWTSPAQLAAIPTLQLCPSSGFNYVVLRYPKGHGFTQRLLYPHSGTSTAQSSMQQPKPPPTLSCAAPCPPQDVCRDSEGHHCLEQERSLENMHHDDLAKEDECLEFAGQQLPHAPAALESSVESFPGDISNTTKIPSMAAAGGIALNAGESCALEPRECRLAASAVEVNGDSESVSATCTQFGMHFPAADALEPAHTSEKADGDVVGCLSLAGPSPVELCHALGQDTACISTRDGEGRLQLPVQDELDSPEAPELPEYQPCIIPGKGFSRRGTTVHARITARADLMYSAPVLVMPKGRRARLTHGMHLTNRSGSSLAPHGSHCEALGSSMGSWDSTKNADGDACSWLSEWNNRSTWIQLLGDQARRKEVETPLSETLRRAALQERQNNQVLHCSHEVIDNTEEVLMPGAGGTGSPVDDQQGDGTAGALQEHTAGLPKLVRGRSCRSDRLRFLSVHQNTANVEPGSEPLTPAFNDRAHIGDGGARASGCCFQQKTHMHRATSIIPAANQDCMLRHQPHRQTAPAAGLHGNRSGKNITKSDKVAVCSSSAAAVDAHGRAMRRHSHRSPPSTKPCPSQHLDLRPSAGRCSSARNLHRKDELWQGPMVHYAAAHGTSELQALGADDMLEEAWEASNLHGSVSLANSGLLCDDADSSGRHSNVSGCMHGGTGVGGEQERAPTAYESALAGIQDRSRAKQRAKKQQDGELLQYDAGLRMAMALQAESRGGVLPQAAARGNVRLQRSRAFVIDDKAHTRHMAWRCT